MRLLLIPILILSGGCERLMDEAEIRAARAKGGGDRVLVGLVWTGTSAPGSSFWEGADLAIELAQKDGSMPRPIETLREIEDGTLTRSKVIAERMAENEDVVAVIGHRDAEAARVTSVSYEYSGVLMMAAGSSNRQLTRAGFERIFRLMPTDEELALRLADHASARGLSPVLIVYANDVHGRAVANAFESRAEAVGVKIADRLAFDSGALRPLERSLEEAKLIAPKAVLLVERMPAAKDIIVLLRRSGIDAPVLATDDLDDKAVLSLKEDIVVATPLGGGDPSDVDVATAFQAKYGRAPDTWAAQGYLGVKLVTDAMARAHSAVPADVAAELRKAGLVKFSARGEPIERALAVKRVVDDRWSLQR